MSDPSTPIIHTPDQRLRIFVSSTLQELVEERKAAREAIEHLRLTPVMFELGARPHPPRDLYRAYLDQSHIFIGIYWQKYGWIAPGEDVSGLEDEYRLSGSKPKLIYLKQTALERELRLTQLLNRIKSDDTAFIKYFSNAAELSSLIENDLALIMTEHFKQVQSIPTGVKNEKPPTNLPTPLNRLIGRDKELITAQELLLRPDVNLVTLTGTAGAGKSLLGINIARALLDHFKHGVFLVRLAPINNPQLVIPTIALGLGVQDTATRAWFESLTDYLHDKNILLMIDNFEQVIESAPLLAQLLEACPQLKMLVTSRISLMLRNEKELPVPPLAVPDNFAAFEISHLSDYSALELFVQRAQGVKRDFHLTSEAAPIVAEICCRLDGLPLAIELAAARIKLLTPQTLLARLEHRFEVLRSGTRDLPERQRTLYDAIDWSYNLLDAPGQQLFQRLAVFAGGWTLEAAEKVCAADDDLAQNYLDALDALSHNSLLISTELNGELRFSMLESIREFALEKLRHSGTANMFSVRHLYYYLELIEMAEPRLNSVDRQSWLDRLAPERDNFRSALALSEKLPNADAELRLVGALGWYWFFSGQISEARVNAEHALIHLEKCEHLKLRAMVLSTAGGAASAQSNYQLARVRLAESAAIFRELGDTRRAAYVLIFLALSIMSLGDVALASETFQTSVDLFKAIGDQWGQAYALSNYAEILLMVGELSAARMACEDGWHLWQRVGDTWGEGNHLCTLGSVEWYDGNDALSRTHLEQSVDLLRQHSDRWGLARALNRFGFTLMDLKEVAQAQDCFTESLDLWRSMGNQRGIVHCLIGFGGVAAHRGQPARSARLLGAVDHLSREALYVAFGIDRARYERTLETARQHVSKTIWQLAFESGQRMTIDEAITLAVEHEPHD